MTLREDNREASYCVMDQETLIFEIQHTLMVLH